MKKTMKTALLVCLALLTCALMFTACDSGNENQMPSGTTDGTTDGTTEPETEAHAHSFGEWTTVKEPTCTEKGEQERVCACGEKEKQSIDIVAHTEVTDEAVAPTCTETGLTEGKHCSVCNTVLVAQKTVTANGHSFGEWKTVKAATCTEEGLEQRFCASCNYTESQAIAAKGHTKDIIPAENATCVSYGTKEGFRCTVCGYYERPIDYDLIPTGNHDYTYHHLYGYMLGCSKCNASTFSKDIHMSDWENIYQGTNVAWRADWSGAVPTRYDFITYITPEMFKSSAEALGAIIMLDNIKYIGASAFEDSYLTYAEFTTAVTKIESRAFANCKNLLCIRYNGTKEQWNAIEKGTDWDDGTGNYTVYCSDGEITKN